MNQERGVGGLPGLDPSNLVQDMFQSVERCQKLAPMPVWNDGGGLPISVDPVQSATADKRDPDGNGKGFRVIDEPECSVDGISPHEDDFAGFGLVSRPERNAARRIEFDRPAGFRKVNAFRSPERRGFSLKAWLGRLVGIHPDR